MLGIIVSISALNINERDKIYANLKKKNHLSNRVRLSSGRRKLFGNQNVSSKLWYIGLTDVTPKYLKKRTERRINNFPSIDKKIKAPRHLA